MFRMTRVHSDGAKRKRKLDSSSTPNQEAVNDVLDMTAIDPEIINTANILINNSKAANRPNSGIMERSLVTAPTVLTIKGLSDVPWDKQKFIDASWSKLKEALTSIRGEMPIKMGLEEVYQVVEQVCSLKGEDVELFRLLTAELEDYAQCLLSQVSDPCDNVTVWLKKLEQAWSCYCNNVTLIRNMFLPLDRMQVANKSICFTAVETFEHVVLGDANVRSKCVQGLLDLVRAERDGEVVDQILMKNLFQMIDKTHVYAGIFEIPFLQASSSYYKAVGVKLIDSVAVPNFLKQINELIEKEKKLASLYLDFESGSRLLNAVEVALMEQHVNVVLERGLSDMLSQNQLDLLRMLYKLCQPVPNGLNLLCKAYGAYIKKVGTAFMNDVESDCTQCIGNLLELKDQLDQVNLKSFDNNCQFVQTTADRLETVLSASTHPPAELVARYMDSKLRPGKGVVTEEDLENLLNKVVVLFRFVPDKDMFETFYQRMLAKRLLQSKSASFDLERGVLNRLKIECGTDFTSRMEVMFKDIELSKELNRAFRQLCRNTDSLEMSVSVLSNISWPNYRSSPVNLPSSMLECQEKFESFYLSKYNGRRINWEHSVGTCVVLANFDMGEKELLLSTYQAIVLLLFTNRDTLSYEEIKSLTAIDDGELERTLQSLACGKYRVILKRPKGKDVEPTDTFTFNSKFENKLMRIKINQVQLKETLKEKVETHEQLHASRMYQLDAAIVRILKMKKRLLHSDLIAELGQQMRFTPGATEIKERIEWMLEQGYLSRDAANAEYYIYIA